MRINGPEYRRMVPRLMRLEYKTPKNPLGEGHWRQFAGSFERVRREFELLGLTEAEGFVCLLRYGGNYWALQNHLENHDKFEIVWLFNCRHNVWLATDYGSLNAASTEFVSGKIETSIFEPADLIAELSRELREEHPRLPDEFFADLTPAQIDVLWQPQAALNQELDYIERIDPRGFLVSQWVVALNGQCRKPRGLFRALVLTLNLTESQWQMLESSLQLVSDQNSGSLRPLHRAALQLAQANDHD